MSQRTKSAERCERCRMHVARCICALVPRVEVATKLVVVMHRREWSKPTGTARLMALAVPGTEIRLRGRPGEAVSGEGLDDPERRAMVLYPSDDAEVLSEELVARDPRPITLVVPDGNWRQAARIPRREPALVNLPRVTLPDLGPTRYRLRFEPKPGGLATYEAMARALGIIEGREVRRVLEELFDAMVEASLEARAGLSAD